MQGQLYFSIHRYKRKFTLKDVKKKYKVQCQKGNKRRQLN